MIPLKHSPRNICFQANMTGFDALALLVKWKLAKLSRLIVGGCNRRDISGLLGRWFG
jgi:hypothetical protein